MSNETLETPRYATPRRLINWERLEETRALKMLAWVVWDRGIHNQRKLWDRVEQLCPKVMEIVLGRPGITLKSICDLVLEQQGLEITLNRLHGRAYSCSWYIEFNEYANRVEEAYDRVTGAAGAGVATAG